MKGLSKIVKEAYETGNFSKIRSITKQHKRIRNKVVIKRRIGNLNRQPNKTRTQLGKWIDELKK